MGKFAYLFVGILFILPIISFAADDNGGLFSFLNFISDQLQILKERIVELIKNIRSASPKPEEVSLLEPIVDKKDKKPKVPVSTPAPTPPPVVSQSVSPPSPPIEVPPQKEAPKSQLSPPSPQVDLRVNGLDESITIIKGDSATLSWSLSDHNWSYCGRSGSWDGTLPIGDGSQNTGPLSYNTTYNLFCYINSTKYADSITILTIEPESKPIASASPPKSTFSIADPGFKTCSLEVSRNLVTMGKDALEATWTIDSDPRSARFYWRGKDNGVDIGRVHGGKTQRIRIFDYGAYPAKYERYVEMFFSQDHFIGDPYTTGCTTNTVIFEVK